MKCKIWIEYDYADKRIINISDEKIEKCATNKLPWIKIFTHIINVPLLTKWNKYKQIWEVRHGK